MAPDVPECMDLLKAARGGSEWALSRLLDDLRPEVTAYLRGRVASNPAPDALAQELAQEVLLRVAESVGVCRAESPAQLRAWVRTIARRAVVDWYRRREPELDRRIWKEWEEVPGDALRSALPNSGSTTRSEVDRVLGELLYEAQAMLSDGTQEVIRRRFLYGDTWAEAGRAIGTTGAGAKRRWQRARKRLRREVVERVEELPPELRREVLIRIGRSPG